MLSCKTFIQHTGSMLKKPIGQSQAVNYVANAAFGTCSSQNDNSEEKGAASKGAVVDYTHILESPPDSQRELYQASNNADQKFKKRIEELKKNRESFGDLTMPIITSLFSDQKMSKNAKDLYNSFTEEIIKEQKKLKSNTNHAESVTNRRNDGSEADISR